MFVWWLFFLNCSLNKSNFKKNVKILTLLCYFASSWWSYMASPATIRPREQHQPSLYSKCINLHISTLWDTLLTAPQKTKQCVSSDCKQRANHTVSWKKGRMIVFCIGSCMFLFFKTLQCYFHLFPFALSWAVCTDGCFSYSHLPLWHVMLQPAVHCCFTLSQHFLPESLNPHYATVQWSTLV